MGVDCLLNHAGDSCSMLLACIAVCMSNTSFSLHGFSVHVPCQTHPPSLSLHRFSRHKTTFFDVLNPPPPSPYFLPPLFLFLAFFFSFFFKFRFLLLLSCAQSFERCFLYPSFTLYLSLEGSEVWAHSTCWWKRHSDGMSVHKHKAIPYCSPSFMFSTMGS